MSPAEGWLRSRLADAPPELLDRMVRAVPAGEIPVSQALADGALALLASLAGGCQRRDDAWVLLAADALLTHAMEAQAETDPGGVAALADRLGPAGRIGAVAEAALPRPE